MIDLSPDDTRRHLTEIPELCALLPDAATTRATLEGPRPAPGSRPPTRLDITHLQDTHTKHHNPNMAACDPDRQGVLPYLWGWVRDIEADALDQSPELPPESPERPTVANCCDWLGKMLEFAATLPQWPELSDGIKQVHASLRQATVDVRDAVTQPVVCNTCHEGHLMEAGPKLWQCDWCDRQVTVLAVTIPQAAKLINDKKGASQANLYRWAKRNLFDRITEGPANLYDLGSIRRVVAEDKLRKVTG